MRRVAGNQHRMGRPGRRLPPFGKALQARGRGLLLIVPGTAAGWRTVRLYPPGDVLVVQIGHDPGLYDWSAVRDCEVVLYTEAFDQRTTDRMVGLLEAAGAAIVCCYAYRPGARVAA